MDLLNIVKRGYQTNRVLFLLVCICLIYVFYTFLPQGYGHVRYKDSNLPVAESFVLIQYRGDSYRTIIPMGHGRNNICITALAKKTNEKGGYIIPGLPFYHSLRFINDETNVYVYKEGFRDTLKYYPHNLSKYGSDVTIGEYNYEDELEVLIEMLQDDLCNMPPKDKHTLEFYKYIYSKARQLTRTSNNPNRFIIARRICNLAIGAPLKEPRADECPWLTDEY